jgi:hypothetical protein
MTEQQEQQPVILTIDDQEYDVNELGNDTKVHYVQVVNLRKQLADLQNQIAAAQQQSINLQVALGFVKTPYANQSKWLKNLKQK